MNADGSMYQFNMRNPPRILFASAVPRMDTTHGPIITHPLESSEVLFTRLDSDSSEDNGGVNSCGEGAGAGQQYVAGKQEAPEVDGQLQQRNKYGPVPEDHQQQQGDAPSLAAGGGQGVAGNSSDESSMTIMMIAQHYRQQHNVLGANPIFGSRPEVRQA
jgi:hypothetical protein